MQMNKQILMSILFSAALASAGCGGDEAVETTDQAIGACDLVTPDQTRTMLPQFVPFTVNTGTGYGLGGRCQRFMLDVKNKGGDGLPIVNNVDITTRYSGPLPTTQANCEGLNMAISFGLCPAAATECTYFINEA